jgi:hypothetical protein
MILLISSHPEVEQCAPVLSRELGERVEYVSALRAAAAKLREHSYQLLLVDERFLQVQASAVDALASHAPEAVAVFFNPAVTGRRRLVLEARAALRRQEAHRRSAQQCAVSILRNELRSDVTGILLSSQLALDTAQSRDAVAANLRSVYTLAERLSKKLA